MDESLRRELGAHLRAARASIAPQDVGLGAGGRRRSPGLRREEVATLAGVSVAWYTWLEQGRVSTSRQVVDAVCRALRMDPVAHRHALALAGFLPPPPRAGQWAAAVPGPDTLALVDSWHATPALVLDERFDVLAANAAHRRLWGPLEEAPAEERNLLLHLAAGPPGRHRITAGPADGNGPGGQALLRGLYEQFRAATAHVPDDPRSAEIVRRLHALRPDAAHWWQCRAVADFRPSTVEVMDTGRPDRVLRLTFSLLRPAADTGVLLLTQHPADATGAALLARLAACADRADAASTHL
ncbi:helix-turn-helix domain-containing protein [Kitasatospora sp. NBC_01246]|uniref:helix-turn-helix domain-containing protein n=1 Tax=Kitasatospora sp. NBC_01246 TaxID=2903570 RepID=UPI002E312D5F|nr:helix-turn-helix domain-containing protein [Kitasatospora sp. NBC_01246]